MKGITAGFFQFAAFLLNIVIWPCAAITGILFILVAAVFLVLIYALGLLSAAQNKAYTLSNVNQKRVANGKSL